MSDTYTKLFSSITESTIVSEPVATRWLWVTMLAMANGQGEVFGSIPGLARRANLTLEETEHGLATFYAPDPYSRTKDNEGRRIEEIEGGGGWLLLNHAKYRAIRSAEERREYMREYMRDKRAREAEPSDLLAEPLTLLAVSTEVTPPAPAPAPVRAEQKKEQVRSPNGSRLPEDFPTPELFAWGQTERPDVDVGAEREIFRDHWRGKAGKDGRKADWPATWRNWVRKAYPTRRTQLQRAGPSAPVGKTMQAIQALEDFKNGKLGGERAGTGAAEIALLESRGSAGS